MGDCKRILFIYFVCVCVIWCSPSSISEYSEEDCSEQMAALDALIVEIQETKRGLANMEEDIYVSDFDDVAPQENSGMPDREHSVSAVSLESSRTERQLSPVKLGSSLDIVLLEQQKRIKEMEEKEKILNECRNQIKVRESLLVKICVNLSVAIPYVPGTVSSREVSISLLKRSLSGLISED